MAYKIWILGFLLVLGTGCSQQPSAPVTALAVHPQLPVCKEDNASEELLVQEPEAEELPQTSRNVSDLERFPQSVSPYVERSEFNQSEPFEIQNRFEENYYRPWSYAVAPICARDAQWPIRSFKGGYGSNLQPIDPTWFEKMEIQSNFEAFSTINQYALTTRWTNIRTFPTHKPLYKNPARPGDGYPFDMLQNSSVAFNEPVFVSHYSQDGAWVYIFTNNASGWVESSAIVLISPNQIAAIREKPKLFITEDQVPLYDEKKRFVTYSRVGMVLPLSEENALGYQALFIQHNGEIGKLTIPKQSAHVGFHFLNKEDLIKIGTQMLRNTYGWGGMFEERDCSSMIREMYTPFGIWLPRNSASQAKKGEVISFNGLNNSQKIALIKEKGVPFQTILYKKGHVLLYVGTYEETVMAMHNIWGIRTIDKNGQKGRIIVGKAVITTLEFGLEAENFDPDNMLLTSLVSMNIFTREPVPVAMVKRSGKKAKL